MSIFVEIKNVELLRKARVLLGAKSDKEAVELPLEYFVNNYERKLGKIMRKIVNKVE